jgi:MerR family copper efflux transcriptional regulator
MSSLKIGALAKAAGVPIDTVRYYERTGLLPSPSRTESGYRAYQPEAVERLRFIRNSKRLGFTLHEIAQLLELRHAGARSEVRQSAREKVEAIDRRIAELGELRHQLVQLIEECADEQHHPDCPILEALHG